MVKVSIEVRSGAACFDVGVQAESIQQAVSFVEERTEASSTMQTWPGSRSHPTGCTTTRTPCWPRSGPLRCPRPRDATEWKAAYVTTLNASFRTRSRYAAPIADGLPLCRPQGRRERARRPRKERARCTREEVFACLRLFETSGIEREHRRVERKRCKEP